MRYTVEIDTKSKKGAEAIKYLRKLNDTKVIAIHQSSKLQSKDVALPTGIIPTDWQWEEYLDRKPGKGKKGTKAFKDMRARFKKKFGE